MTLVAPIPKADLRPIKCLWCSYEDEVEFDLSLHFLERHKEQLLSIPISARERKITKSLFRSKKNKDISDIYKLVDHEGNEITISELIDRYLSNPELCFKVKVSASKSQAQNLHYAIQIMISHLQRI